MFLSCVLAKTREEQQRGSTELPGQEAEEETWVILLLATGLSPASKCCLELQVFCDTVLHRHGVRQQHSTHVRTIPSYTYTLHISIRHTKYFPQMLVGGEGFNILDYLGEKTVLTLFFLPHSTCANIYRYYFNISDGKWRYQDHTMLLPGRLYWLKQ